MSIDKNVKIMDKLNQSILESKSIKENLPCNNCDGDCCGTVVFTMDELIKIFDFYKNDKKFRKRFPWNENYTKKHLTMIEAFPNSGKEAVKIFFKTKAEHRKNKLGSDSCIFKDNEETGGCLIYDNRPLICREYGKRECLKCPYTGLDEQPKNLDVRKQLIQAGHQHRNNQVLIEQQAYLNFKI